MNDAPIILPTPEQIEQRIELRQEEIRQLKRIYELSKRSKTVAELARQIDEKNGGQLNVG